MTREKNASLAYAPFLHRPYVYGSVGGERAIKETFQKAKRLLASLRSNEKCGECATMVGTWRNHLMQEIADGAHGTTYAARVASLGNNRLLQALVFVQTILYTNAGFSGPLTLPPALFGAAAKVFKQQERNGIGEAHRKEFGCGFRLRSVKNFPFKNANPRRKAMPAHRADPTKPMTSAPISPIDYMY